MRVVVPFAARRPKTRLSDALSADERAAFARAMLADVLAAVAAAGREPEVLATAPLGVEWPVTVDERPLTAAVNRVLAGEADDASEDEADDASEVGVGDEAVAVVMADLPLATPAALSRLFDADGGVVLVPGRGGGTNALVARHPEFRVDYHGASYRDHRAAARRAGVEPAAVDSYRLSTDVDERGDLVEVLLHADGRARDWLVDAGFELSVTEGRVGVERR